MNGSSSYWRFIAAIVGTAAALDIAWHWLRQAMPLVVILIVVVGLAALWRFWRDRGW